MNNELSVIDSLEELEAFLLSVENGGLGLQSVEGVGMATNNADGRHFVAVFNDKQQLIYGRWVSNDVFENGKELVSKGPRKTH
ncbi:hypothetical protein AYY19_08330 [Photobacterium aquimaris]|uniref:Uncharacterized protein n=1 Tax=Photobacterium aquimaris TaxID=512643 RepID=A0A2T3ILQ3_9GAMM|nr:MULTISPECIES: hypothetical protein [Photobacterium]OBU12931.1 hypothetical protein AYY19_08330 [Photobacterium aquimaris]OBU22503.1 hypothetical protein AYY20_11860 [Photobacterium aquimaris]PSU29277.1 hypothetical protein CTM88_09500 [Photobacterium aquimaris]PSW00843.1 hypothetical protein CTM91_10590 [Photobacterium aquimaris]